MTTAFLSEVQKTSQAAKTMKALAFHGPNQIAIEAMPIPKAGYGEAVLRVTLTTICGTDVHILRGEYPAKPGLIVGHEAVGVIHELGSGVTGYKVGDRVLVGAIAPCGQCFSCLNGSWSQCGGVPIGGWKFGNTIHGAQAAYLLVPYAQANMAKIPDEQVVTTLCPGGKERMRRFTELVLHQHVDLTPLLTHSFSLEEIAEAYALFSEHRDGVVESRYSAARATVLKAALEC